MYKTRTAAETNDQYLMKYTRSEVTQWDHNSEEQRNLCYTYLEMQFRQIRPHGLQITQSIAISSNSSNLLIENY